MYADISFLLSLVFIFGGFALLAWSSDYFVDASAMLARRLGVSPMIIGMVIIGFGTSAPELCVSAMTGISGHSNMSLGNAYGSCIFNILAILGVAALIRPLKVKSSVVKYSVPSLLAITGISFAYLKDGVMSRVESLMLLAIFLALMGYNCYSEHNAPQEESPSLNTKHLSLITLILKLFLGLTVLVLSSHVLVWGAVDFARMLGVSELLIGLTIIAIGTSLPELASAIASARRGEHEFVIGNIVGSNLFNTLAVVGIAGSLTPIKDFSPYILYRDLPIMLLGTSMISLFGFNWRKPQSEGHINRLEGALWVLSIIVYFVLTIYQETHNV
ncbi:MAG: calcium/sodium antiporter [Kiritimatiellae bacterium]|nr:calcium/sodium antiporter [Kiritimatiellia bacterium]